MSDRQIKLCRVGRGGGARRNPSPSLQKFIWKSHKNVNVSLVLFFLLLWWNEIGILPPCDAAATATATASSSSNVTTITYDDDYDDDDAVTVPVDYDYDNDATAVVHSCHNPNWFGPLFSPMLILTTCGCIYFVGVILLSANLRHQGYNLYLVFLILPDALINLSACITGNIPVRSCSPSEDIKPQSMIAGSFYYIANLTLNAVVAYEVFRMAQNSYRMRKRTKPSPSYQRVCIQSAICYLWAIWMAIWFKIGEIGPKRYGSKPIPWALTSYDDGDVVKFGSEMIPAPLALTIVGGSLLVPILYVVWVGCRLRPILPRSGRTRALSMYFMRILIVFFVFYIPNLLIGLTLQHNKVVNHDHTLHYTLTAIAWVLCLTQALVTLYMASQKNDIQKELMNGITRIRSSLITISTIQSSIFASSSRGTSTGRISSLFGGRRKNISDKTNAPAYAEDDDNYDNPRPTGDTDMSTTVVTDVEASTNFCWASAAATTTTTLEEGDHTLSGNNNNDIIPDDENPGLSIWEEEDVYDDDDPPSFLQTRSPSFFTNARSVSLMSMLGGRKSKQNVVVATATNNDDATTPTIKEAAFRRNQTTNF